MGKNIMLVGSQPISFDTRKMLETRGHVIVSRATKALDIMNAAFDLRLENKILDVVIADEQSELSVPSVREAITTRFPNVEFIVPSDDDCELIARVERC